MQITVNQYSVAYDVGLSQLYDNQLNSSLECSSENSTTTNKTPHEVCLPAEPAQTKSSFIPDKCRLARQRPTRRYPTPTPFPKTLRQMAVLAISSYFHFFRVFINNFLDARRLSAGFRAKKPSVDPTRPHKCFRQIY